MTNPRGPMRTAAALLCLAMLPATSALAQSGQAAAIPAPAQGAWPQAEFRQGRYFAFVGFIGD